MRILFFLVLLIGLGIASFAGFLVLQRFETYNAQIVKLRKEVGEKVELAEVAIAVGDLSYGAPLVKENIKFVKWPVSAIPEEAFKSDLELFGDPEDKQPERTVLRAIDSGEIISARKVTSFGEDAGVASRLERGMRAFTLKVDVASGVSGFLRPSDRVDVYWTGRTENDGTVSRLILDGVQLIAIDQLERTDRNRPVVARTVTVAVSPARVASLAQAQATGKLQLSLRGIGDDTLSGNIEVNQDDLLGREVQQEVREKQCSIKSRKGGEVIETIIPCPQN